ncbi:MAG TPA: MFS transporter [Bacillota bacterium]|nr:MFS transporter [Bacillota bacterium]
MPRYVWILVIASTIQVTGASFLWPLNTIYMHNELGKSLAFAGLILMFNQGAAIVGNLIGGVLFDKISAYKTILIGTSITLGSAVIMAFNHSIVPYSILLIIIGFGSGVTQPVMFALAGSVWPEGGRRAFNAVYVARNVGVALGATIAGYVADISFTYTFMANASMFAVFFLIVIFTFRGMERAKDERTGTATKDQIEKTEDKRAFIGLLILSCGFLIAWLTYSQWQSTIASHTQDIGIPLDQYSTIWAINGTLIVLGQPLVKWFTTKVIAQKKHIYVGNAIFILSFIVASFSETFTMFAVAMVILTLGEMLVWPAVPSLANELAPTGRAGFYQGFVNSIAAAGRMSGPFIGGLIVDLYSIDTLFIVMYGLLVIPFITTYFYDRGVRYRINRNECVQ